MDVTRGRRCPRWVPALVLLATVGQLALATFATGLAQFEGKAFGARLVAYPVLMLLVPLAWWATHRRGLTPTPWGAFALVMAPFLIDVSGNTLDLYDSVDWWDDANHFVNWSLLCGGLGMLVLQRIAEPWVRTLLVTGLGAVLAIAWEVAEWWTFIRHGTELGTAYTDTLGDEVLGTAGALVAGLLLSRRAGSVTPGPVTPGPVTPGPVTSGPVTPGPGAPGGPSGSRRGR
ncbi:hypothetical protein [Phycicoccus sp. Root101]|uniref:hypothetical protein n=1 Tax=Phycicoccus sp. Root101 TaxID=1736421 RepID=UPI000AF6CC3B|nr:hypothetical protein [Phycicoccus sp. Root101]